ncbi:ABC transporter substrate-binding protein [Paenibacillus sp. TRM 82003]|nr:ABC transporter substrate-binding protein [Paenibacillus sp. TRM 82003]
MKKLGLIVLTAFTAVSLAACGGGATGSESTNESGTGAAAESSNEPVNIIITNGKGEIASQFDQAAKDFMAVNPDITVEVRSAAVGDTMNVFDLLTASGKTATIAMFDPSAALNKYKDVGIDLSGEKWVAETDNALKNEQGQIVGFPFAIEGFGLVYNKQVVEKAVGGAFDPFTINTRDKLVELFDKLQASGVAFPVAYQTESWSVSNHYSTQFINQAEDPASVVKQLQEGSFDLASNAVWNGYYDTMDLLASEKYNKYGERPLGAYYDDAHVSVGKGESALLFNGNWAYDSLQAVAGDQFGFIPVPVDNDENNPLNNKIAAGATQVLVINAKATAEEQAAGKKFLEWLVYDEKGQDFVVNQAQIISAFKNNANKVTNPLGAAIGEAIAASKTMPFSTNFVVAEEWNTIIGPEVQKYIAGKLPREELAAFIENYYQK